jgi:CheY-like chemotaxis protein
MILNVNPLPPSLCVGIISDKHWFIENMLCLLSNACKYGNGGAVTVTVELIDTKPPPESDPPYITEVCDTSPIEDVRAGAERPFTPSIMLSIEDSGIGISIAGRKDLFQPFKQVQRLAGGTGLGLYSLSSRIHALQGSRGVCSRKDGKQGSTFWFAIPYHPHPCLINVNSFEELHTVNSSFKVRSSRPSPFATPDLEKCYRFLIVDDSPSILKVLGRVLTSKNHLVETAEDGSQALDRLIKGYSTNDFDVVLMDLQMPVMDGIEAVRRYRDYESAQNESLCLSQSTRTVTENPSISEPWLSVSPSHSKPSDATATNGRRLFIIGMSANSDGPTKQCALDAGMDFFLPKPFKMTELQPLVDHLLTPRPTVRIPRRVP